jgi:pyruvate/2-oxoacid:ferredoxin oxidoreductase beta subunit
LRNGTDRITSTVAQGSDPRALAIIIAYAHCIEQGLLTKTGPAHQKAAVESVHFPLWRYNPDATGKKLVLGSADKSETVSFAYPPLVGGSRSARTHPKRKRGRANAVSKELGENRFKQLVKKIGQDKAMEILKGAEEGWIQGYEASDPKLALLGENMPHGHGSVQ